MTVLNMLNVRRPSWCIRCDGGRVYSTRGVEHLLTLLTQDVAGLADLVCHYSRCGAG